MQRPRGFVAEADLGFAVLEAHALETRLLQVRVERLTAVLCEHGLPMPGDDPRLGTSDGDHLEACRLVVRRAYELREALNALDALIGSGTELLEQSWRA